jgi:hypothetical protein
MLEMGRVEKRKLFDCRSRAGDERTVEKGSLWDKVRQATLIYLGRITSDTLDETTSFGTFLNPVFGSSDRWSDIVNFGLDKGSIGMDTLSVTFEIMKT